MLLSIPVEPDADTARDWARDELAKREYHDQGSSWLTSFFEWLQDWLNSLTGVDTGMSGGSILLTVLVFAAVVGLVVWLVMGPLRRSRRATREHSVFDDDHRTSRQMLSAAEVAAKSGDWATAVIEMYRVLVRSLEEREILDDRPGMTAFEAARETAGTFPDAGPAMMADADVFDGLRYGHFAATREHYDHVVATHALLAGRSRLEAAR